MHQPEPTTAPEPDFADRLAAHLRTYGHRDFIEFEQRWHTGDEITAFIDAILRELREAGAAADAPVALVARNRVPHAAAILGLLADRRPVEMIYSYQSTESIAADITALAPQAVIADREDWTEATLQAALATGAAAISLSNDPLAVTTMAPLHQRPRATQSAGLHILTSGTTGPPKRLPLPISALDHTVMSMTMGASGEYTDPPDLVCWPFGSVGICQLLAAPFSNRRLVLLEKFTVSEWVRAVKKYQMTRVGVQPTILRMLLDADVEAGDLASLTSLPGGSGPLEPSLRRQFEERFRIPLLWAYGAMEFAGTVAAWTLDDHNRFGTSKPTSVGRPLPGVAIRIVDPSTDEQVPTGERGVLAARIDRLGLSWTTTTDIASVDDDGFLYIHGRADRAINRGGFKVLPETVRTSLLDHPAVLDAAVVGVPDRLVGEVPYAVVEIRRGHRPPTESELKSLLRRTLPAHHVPVAVDVIDALPRNAAMKVPVAALVARYADRREDA